MREIVLSSEQEVLYAEFVFWSERTKLGEILYEGKMSDKLKTVVSFIKDFAIKLGCKIKDVIQVFLDKQVFSFFSEFDWSIDSFSDFMKKGYEIWKKIVNLIPDFLTYLAKQGLDLIHDQNNPTKFTKILNSIEDFFESHPTIRKISGVALAGLLIYLWVNMSFVGDPFDDFDMGDILDAFFGRISFVQFFTSENGLKSLVLFATGMLGISIAWFSGPINILVAVTTTIARSLKKRLSRSTPREISSNLMGLENESEESDSLDRLIGALQEYAEHQQFGHAQQV